MNDYEPQLFDKYLISALKNDWKYGDIYSHYKAGELTGTAVDKHEELLFLIKKARKKLLVPSFLAMIFTGAFMLIGVSILRGSVEVGFEAAYGNAPYFFWMLPFLAIISVICIIISVKVFKKFKIYITELSENEGKELDRLVKQQFDLPDSTVPLSVFSRFVRAVNNKPIKNKVVNMTVSAYSDDENVYFYIDTTLLKIPQRDCFSAEMIEAKIFFQDLGMLDLKSPECKSYGIRKSANRNNMTIVKCYGRLLFQYGGQVWALDVLPFCLDAAKKLFNKS